MAHSTRRTFLEGAGVWVGTVAVGCAPGLAGQSADGNADGSDGETEAAGDASTQTDSGSSESGAHTTSEDEEGSSTGASPACAPTSPNIEGPYYLEGVPVRTDLDLYGDEGTKLALSGVVRATDCAPIAGAIVEIWQCDPAGEYDASPQMRYRGQTVTDAEGRYAFRTLVPGRYPNAGTFRPAHIHVKVWIERIERLTTQIYFEGDPFNDTDPWVEDDLILFPEEDGEGGLLGVFDLVID